jgi:hypothetical protein
MVQHLLWRFLALLQKRRGGELRAVVPNTEKVGLTSRSSKGHHNNMAEYRKCNHSRHYTRSNVISEDILDEYEGNIERTKPRLVF